MKTKREGLAEDREMCVEWNHSMMKQGLGKLQMKQLTKIAEHTLEKNVFLGG